MDVNSLGPEVGLVQGGVSYVRIPFVVTDKWRDRTEDSIRVKVFVFVRPRITRIYLEV